MVSSRGELFDIAGALKPRNYKLTESAMTGKRILAAVLLAALAGFEPAEGYAQAPVC